MKKQIAILATIIAASGFTALGQDWSVVQTSGNNLVWDEFTTPGTSHAAPLGDVNVEVLWALTGTADALGAGVASTGGSSSGGAATISSMLTSGWTLAQNFGSGAGSATLGTVETTSGGTVSKGGSIVAYNGGNPFEITQASTGGTGSTIEEVLIAFNGSDYSSSSALGWSSMINEQIGLTAGDINSTEAQTSAGLTSFGVASVPEPTTLALAGLGGLSMLFLRRRKA